MVIVTIRSKGSLSHSGCIVICGVCSSDFSCTLSFVHINGRMFALQSFRMFAQHSGPSAPGSPSQITPTSDLQQNPPVPHDCLARLMIQINESAFFIHSLKQYVTVVCVIFGLCLLHCFAGFHSLIWVVWFWIRVCRTQKCALHWFKSLSGHTEADGFQENTFKDDLGPWWAVILIMLLLCLSG